MPFKEGALPQTEQEQNIEAQTQEKESNVYEKAREDTDVFLKNIEFAKKEDLVEINPREKELKDEVPVLVIGGWGVSVESQKEGMEAISNEGRKTTTVRFEREEKIKQEDEKNIPIAELQKALTIVDAIEAMGVEKVDATGHSEGGLALAIAASLYPERFRNIVFVSPAGMMEKDSYLDLIKRFTVDEGVEEFKNMETSQLKSFYDYLKGVSKYIIKNPLMAHKEIKAMNQMDIFEMTKHLKEQGIGVGFVCGANDKVFPIEEVVKYANKQNLDYFVSTKGNHGSFIFDKQHALLAEDLLDNMNKDHEES
ncbi:MAG: alpha/beta hydrolase [Candidatus Paceibacterota bacterium]